MVTCFVTRSHACTRLPSMRLHFLFVGFISIFKQYFCLNTLSRPCEERKPLRPRPWLPLPAAFPAPSGTPPPSHHPPPLDLHRRRAPGFPWIWSPLALALGVRW